MLKKNESYESKITVVQDTPEILCVKENQKNFSSVLYKEDVSPGTAIGKTPEMMRVKQTQDHISSVKYKEAVGQGTPIPDLPEVKRVKETQKHISSRRGRLLLCNLTSLQTCKNHRAPTATIIFSCYPADNGILHPISSIYCWKNLPCHV
uniref:Uncharacterized protein n=1 Tax=Balaenoptera musculus TaxID=9771 RepID=A0A8C0DJM3_BALMU